MGNCLRLGISRIGLAWSKWRMSAKFKRKQISIILLGMQAVGKSTIALRLYKFKRTLPDTNYVQTKGFSTFMVKRKKTTINIYDLGGHPSIQELWDHYYADAHGIIFVVDSSDRETVPEAGHLLSKVLSDHRIRGKPVLLLANKIDLDGVSESELDSMLNLQQVVNSVRCLTRVDVSCATDLKNDKGIFEGFTWLVSYIESNFVDLNNRVLSDTMEEKNREKARREAVKAARLADNETIVESVESIVDASGTPVGLTSPSRKASPTPKQTPPTSPPSKLSVDDATTPTLVQEGRDQSLHQEAPLLGSTDPRHFSPPTSLSKPETKLSDVLKSDYIPHSKIPLPLLPPINTVPAQLVDQPIKLPRLKSPKSRPEIINRIEDHAEDDDGNTRLISSANNHEPAVSDQYYNEKGFRFRQISAARRLSPEGADSDDGIVNLAYEPTEDISSDSTPIGARRHNFSNSDVERPSKELFMVTTLAEVHKEYFKDRKGSTSTHDSISMSVASEATDSINEDGQSGNVSFSKQEENIPLDNLPKKSSTRKVKSKRRLNIKPRLNKTAPLPLEPSSTINLPPSPGGTEAFRNFPTNSIVLPSDSQQNLNQLGHNHNNHPSSSVQMIKQGSRNSSASSKTSNSNARVPFAVGNAWERNPEILEQAEASKLDEVGTVAEKC